MKLSKNFSLAELTKSQTAERMGLNNSPNEDNASMAEKIADRKVKTSYEIADHNEFSHLLIVSKG